MKTKIISILILISLSASTIGIAGIASQTYLISCTGPDPSKSIEVVKLIKNNSDWVSGLDATVGSIVSFKINVTYHDTDGSGKGKIIVDIVVKDILPDGLEYADNATLNGDPCEPIVSLDGKNLTWDINQNLMDNESHIIEFDVLVTGTDEQINMVNVSATEHCYNESRWGEAQATVNGLPSGLDKVYNDVDDDGIDEIAINENNDSSDGYEIYQDPNDNSTVVLRKDGDGDGKYDYFIDYKDDEQPDRYWDPDDGGPNGTLTDIEIIDVDYDDTDEWVFDSDGKDGLDKYYDPDDQQIHEYVVFTLTVGIDGNGIVFKEPDGTLFLKDFVVELEAQPLLGSNSVFDHWSEDLSGNNSTETIVMNEDKTVTAHFKENPVLPFVEIIRPAPNHWYLFNLELESSEDKPKIFGPIKVIVNATGENGIDRVEFYLNDELEPRHTDDSPDYTWFWLFKPLGKEENFTITVKAYDKIGNTNTDSITVTRVRLLPKIALGVLVLGGLYLLINREAPQEDETVPVEPDTEPGSNTEPIADAGGPYTGSVGKSVRFDGSKSYDPDGDALDYEWSFGDGSTGAGETPLHTYEKEGEYTVTLTVTDSNGASDTDTAKVEITKEASVTGDLFWYIVGVLCIILTALLGLIYFRRRTYV
jgi:hypothetical protein